MKYLLKISIKCPKIEISFDAGKTSKKPWPVQRGIFLPSVKLIVEIQMQKVLYSLRLISCW